MKTYTIDVTEEDIREGDRGSVDSCPVALAFERATGLTPEVQEEFIETVFQFLDLPSEACQFIEAFDEGRPVSPFSFRVEVMDEGYEDDDEGDDDAR